MIRYIFLILFLSSCLSSTQPVHLAQISIGMQKEQVFAKLEPRKPKAIGAKQYDGSVIEVFQYSRRTKDSWTDNEFYWLYFYNGRLSQWGKPGDWQRESDVIYEVRSMQPFRTY